MCYTMKLTIMTNTSCFWSFPMHVLDNWLEWRYKTIHLIGHNPSNEMKPLKDSMTPAPDKLYTMSPCMQQCKWICRWLQNDIYYVFGGCLTCMRCQQSIALGTIKSTIFCQIDFLTYFSFCLLRFLHPFHLLDICKICSLKISSKNIS